MNTGAIIRTGSARQDCVKKVLQRAHILIDEAMLSIHLAERVAHSQMAARLRHTVH